MDKQYIKDIIKRILDREFSNVHKRKIVEYYNRLNFACPYCGDSFKNQYAKRGNLYLNSLVYVCFNCDKKTYFDGLCKDFDEIIDADKKLEMLEYISNNVVYSNYRDDFFNTKLKDLIDIEDLQRVFEHGITPIRNFSQIDKNGVVYDYLIKRGIPEYLHKDIYQAKYYHGDKYYEWILVILNRKDNKVLSIQIRNLKSGKKRFFKLYNYEHLLNWVNMLKTGSTENTDGNGNKMNVIAYNKLSCYFNIFNINFEEEITIFEGYLDSLFFPNSIGLVGVNTDSKFLEDNNLSIRFVFDNDTTGYIKAEEKIKRGYSVFLWKKFFNHVVKNKKRDDPYKLLYRINKIKDMCDLAKYVNEPYDKLSLWNYFSVDVFDLIWIPKRKDFKVIKK